MSAEDREAVLVVGIRIVLNEWLVDKSRRHVSAEDRETVWVVDIRIVLIEGLADNKITKFGENRGLGVIKTKC